MNTLFSLRYKFVFITAKQKLKSSIAAAAYVVELF